MGDVPRRPGARVLLLLIATCGACLGRVAPVSADPSAPASAPAEVRFVQAVPGARVDLSVDGRVVRRGIAPRAVLGPLRLEAGSHRIQLTNTTSGGTLETDLPVRSGATLDLVMHRPATDDGRDVVSLYRTPGRTVTSGKARVLVAHTAVVPPADVLIDGRVVFSNIANGEFATADVPAGTLEVELTPTGSRKDPLLGPVDVPLAGGTATMIYAVGKPSNGSMDVISHTVDLRPAGSSAPRDIRTGGAGLAGRVESPFGAVAPGSARARTGSPGGWLPAGGLVAAGCVAVSLVAGRRARSAGVVR